MTVEKGSGSRARRSEERLQKAEFDAVSTITGTRVARQLMEIGEIEILQGQGWTVKGIAKAGEMAAEADRMEIEEERRKLGTCQG